MPDKRRHGGKRHGAGRHRGSGPYGEPTLPIRVPLRLVTSVKELLSHATQADLKKAEAFWIEGVYWPAEAASLPLTLYATRVAAGFPSPADDYVEGQLDLNSHLIKHPAATFFVRVAGDSMIGAGIHSGDILVVDRALEPVDGKIVIAVLDGELTVKRLRRRDGVVCLVAENEHYPLIPINEDMDFMIWGVVTSVIHQL
jgi:DNA polymerase V